MIRQRRGGSITPFHFLGGAGEPVQPSIRSDVHGPVNQLRDPCLFEEDGHTWLLYAAAGESGIGLVELID